jgi:hypothetical protein
MEATIIFFTIGHIFLGPTKKSPTFKVTKNIVILRIKYISYHKMCHYGNNLKEKVKRE